MIGHSKSDPRSYAPKYRDTSGPGRGDDVPCVACGKAALDTGLECGACGHDNYEAVMGRPFGTTAPAPGQEGGE